MRQVGVVPKGQHTLVLEGGEVVLAPDVPVAVLTEYRVRCPEGQERHGAASGIEVVTISCPDPVTSVTRL